MNQPQAERKILDQRGATAMMVVMLTGVLVMFAAFAIDVGHALVTRNELQNAADSAALSAARQLGLVHVNLTIEEQQDLNRVLTGTEQGLIAAAAQTASGMNSASDLASVALSGADIQTGFWNFGVAAPIFVATTIRPNAVQVTARRDSSSGSPNAPIDTFFAGIFGVAQMNVNATSVAALDTIGGTAAEGAIDAPFGIDENYFANNTCGSIIKFSPTTDSCAAWHNFTNDAHNTPAIASTIDGLANDSFQSPIVEFGTTTFDFTGGEINPLFSNLRDLFEAKKDPIPDPMKPTLVDENDYPLLDSDGDPFVDDTGNPVTRYEWSVEIPVYEDPGSAPGACSNANNDLVIIGMASATVTYVGEGTGGGPQTWEKNREIFAEIECDTFVDATPSSTGNGPRFPWDPFTPYPRIVS
jgi:Flp pilus assembly protein TadG